MLKHDGDSIFHGRRVQALLGAHRVTALSGPRGYAKYNGKQERSMRDIKSYERVLRRHGVGGTLRGRLKAAIHDLNAERARPVRAGRTTREAYEQDRVELADRRIFHERVECREQELRAGACSRRGPQSGWRRAVEQVLLGYGLMKE